MDVCYRVDYEGNEDQHVERGVVLNFQTHKFSRHFPQAEIIHHGIFAWEHQSSNLANCSETWNDVIYYKVSRVLGTLEIELLVA